MHITHNTVYVQFCTLYRMNLKYSFNTVCSEVIFTVGGGGGSLDRFLSGKTCMVDPCPFPCPQKFTDNSPRLYPYVDPLLTPIEEGWREKIRQRSSCLFGGQIYSILCRASYSLPRSIWKNGMNSTFSSISTEEKQLARQGIE